MNSKWYQHGGAEGDVVISTRVRLARNLAQYPFPMSMSPEQKEEVLRIFEQVFRELPCGQPLAFDRMTDIRPVEAQSMVEPASHQPRIRPLRSGQRPSAQRGREHKRHDRGGGSSPATGYAGRPGA